MNELRKPAVSGQFYESNSERLKKQIESCFLHSLGPKKLFKKGMLKSNIGMIVPHAGYFFSGACAANAYFELAKYNPELVVLMGPGHTGMSNFDFSVSFKDFETPLGIVKNDKEISLEIVKKTEARQDEQAHEHEHSLEVQLPFLQSVLNNFKIIPLIISTQDYEKCKKFALDLFKILEKKNFVIITSSDFTHYGQNYNFLPFQVNRNFQEKLYSLDKKIINKILKLDSKSFFDEASKSTVCGLSPIVVVIEICKLLKKKAKLLKYYTSADIIKGDNAVGYASVLFS